MFGSLPVNVVKTPGLDLAINEGTNEPSSNFLGRGVAGGLSVRCYVILVRLGGLESSRTGDQLMRNSSVVGSVAVLVVGLSLIGVAAEPTHSKC